MIRADGKICSVLSSTQEELLGRSCLIVSSGADFYSLMFAKYCYFGMCRIAELGA